MGRTGVASRRDRACEEGLSLLELVVALALVAILLSVAFTGPSMLANRRLTGTARKLATDMRMIEQRARTERTCYAIVFVPVGWPILGGTYSILQYTGTVVPAPSGGGNQCPDLSWSASIIKEDSSDIVSRRMPAGISLVSTTFGFLNTVTFSPIGTPNAGTVTMRSSSGQERRVVLTTVGRVRIEP